MLIYIGADHRGFNLKESLKNFLGQSGYETVDVGNDRYDENDDYPDFAAAAVRAISKDPMAGNRGILICGSGAGMDIAANKFRHIRSALACNPDQAYSSRNEDDSNVLCLAADFVDEETAKQIVKTWLATPFSGNERFRRRLEKIDRLETP